LRYVAISSTRENPLLLREKREENPSRGSERGEVKRERTEEKNFYSQATLCQA